MHLKDFIARQRKPLTVADVAKKCGVTRQAVHSWMAGRLRPSLRNQVIIERMTSGAVSREAWAEVYGRPKHPGRPRRTQT